MEPLFLIIVIVAMMFAARGAYRGVSGSYRRRMDAWGQSHPDASRVGQRAAALGQMAATLWYGGPALKAGAKHGWREGWASGKEWAERHKPIPVEPEVVKSAPQPEPKPRPSRRPDGRADLRPVPNPPAPNPPVNKQLRCRYDDCTSPPKPGSAYCEEHHRQEYPDSNPPQGGNNTMPINTATGGEVTSPETLAAELTTIVEEAAADLQDAAGDTKRAEEDLGRIERMVASLTNLKLPQSDIAIVAGLTEPAQMRVRAAGARQAAAEKRLAQARAALDMANGHIQIQGRAAGEFYGN